MKRRFILYRRKRGGMFYVEDTATRKQESLGTKSRAEALTLMAARNESVRQPQLNLHIARTYLAASDPQVTKRTWTVPLEELAKAKTGVTHERWLRVLKDEAFKLIRELPILETRPENPRWEHSEERQSHQPRAVPGLSSVLSRCCPGRAHVRVPCVALSPPRQFPRHDTSRTPSARGCSIRRQPPSQPMHGGCNDIDADKPGRGSGVSEVADTAADSRLSTEWPLPIH